MNRSRIETYKFIYKVRTDLDAVKIYVRELLSEASLLENLIDILRIKWYYMTPELRKKTSEVVGELRERISNIKKEIQDI